jgi:asparagine synthase (glutamine-hydrolysing)
MLSGGLDSGSVSAIGASVLEEAGSGPLFTFSAMAPESRECPESRAIRASQRIPGIDAHSIHYGQLQELAAEINTFCSELDEPFDNHMILQWAVYVLARRRAIRAVLDGGCGDVVFSEGTHLGRLLRAGRLGDAVRAAHGFGRFHGGGHRVWIEVARLLAGPLVPLWARAVCDPVRRRGRIRRSLVNSLISSDFAEQVAMPSRLEMLDSWGLRGVQHTHAEERARAISHPYVTVGRERYDRVAAMAGIEPRDPFLDLRVVQFCLDLPAEYKLGARGWPKYLLRRALTGILPDEVAWRRGQPHLGWAFVLAGLERLPRHQLIDFGDNGGNIKPYVDRRKLARARRRYLKSGGTEAVHEAYTAFTLAAWLKTHAKRPECVGASCARSGVGAPIWLNQ